MKLVIFHARFKRKKCFCFLNTDIRKRETPILIVWIFCKYFHTYIEKTSLYFCLQTNKYSIAGRQVCDNVFPVF